MNTRPGVDEQLEIIRASCPRLLNALHHSPEAVWGELQTLERVCGLFEEAWGSRPSKAEEAASMIGLVTSLREQMARQGLMDHTEFAAFRANVAAIESCAKALKASLHGNQPSPRGGTKKQPVKTYVFYCSNHLEADQLANFSRGLEGDRVKPISLPCSGKVDLPYLVKAFETGADGVVLVTCKKNECRHFEGNLRAHKRAEAVEGLLEEIGLGAGRMAVLECPEGGAGQVLGEINQFMDRVRNLPSAPARSATVNAQ